MNGRVTTDRLRVAERDEESLIPQLREQLRQCEVDKCQLQASYDEALLALAESEAKRETAERELKIAQDQMSSMWKELNSLHRKLNEPQTPTSSNSFVNESSLELYCALCREKLNRPQQNNTIANRTSRLWPFGRKQPRANDDLSRLSSSTSNSAPSSRESSPPKSHKSIQNSSLPTDTPTLVINVTRSPSSQTELAPFKVVTKTNMPQFTNQLFEVYRSAGDFQWLHTALQECCPERIIPPLSPPVSLDATVSEYQRFLSRISNHKVLRTEHLMITFLTVSAEELRTVRAKHRPRDPHEESVQYRPAQGRDTSGGALVSTKQYLLRLETSITGLVSQLKQQAGNRDNETVAGWFRAISDGETCDTYVKMSADTLARTCEAVERDHSDGDEALCVQNLISTAGYVHTALDLLTRVENSVDRFLYWDEEVTIYEAVNSSPATDNVSPSPSSFSIPNSTVAAPPSTPVDDSVYDDSGVSSAASTCTTSTSSGVGGASHVSPSHHENGLEKTLSEKWAEATANCSDAKEYLEMMCKDLTSELAHFDLRKEQELKQIFQEFAAVQLEKHEKFQGKWYALRYLLDAPINPQLRAIQFMGSSEQQSTGTQ